MRNYDEIRKNFYRNYTDKQVNKELVNYINQELDLTNGFTNKGKSTRKMISKFFDKDIYKATTIRGAVPPSEAIHDDELLDKIFEVIDSKPSFYDSNDDVTNLKRFLRNGGRWSCKVAAFSPTTARKIYETLCPKENANILDYSCGFGGRMLGSVSPKYHYNYYGIDPNTNLINSLNKFGEFINTEYDLDYHLYCQGSEEYIEELEGIIDFAFSSPPYFNLEVYCHEDTQSIIKFPEYEDWLNGYVTPTIQNIYKYLKPDGLFAVNIKNSTYKKGLSLFDDWKRIALENGFEEVECYDMKHQTGKDALKAFKEANNIGSYSGGEEPLIVFKKINN